MSTPPRPYAEAATDYLTTGLGIPIPIDGKVFHLKGFSGGEGEATAADVDRWLDHNGSMNLGVILDETVIAIDVDHGYAGRDGRVKHGAETIAAYEHALGPLPPTVSSTSRHDAHPESRVRFYRVTAADGAALRHSVDLRADGELISKRPDGSTKGDVEVIHHRYRYVAVWPSIHPDTGQQYRWYAADRTLLDGPPNADFDLPDLPLKWAQYLVGKAVSKANGTTVTPATHAEVQALLTDGDLHPELAEMVRRFWTEDISHGEGVEEESDLLGMTSGLARLTVDGASGSRTALQLCRAGFTRAPYGEDPWGGAFDAALAGSIAFWRRRRNESDAIRGALFPDAETPHPPVETTVADGTVTTGPSTDPADAYQAMAAAVPAVDQEVIQEVRRRVVRAEAERILAERDAVAVVLPRVVRLDRFLDEPDEDPTWRVEGVWPTGGNIVLAAPAKAGKSSMNENLIRSLVDGTPFLGRYEPAPCRVVLLDDELDERTLRRWLRDQGIENTDRVHLTSLRGRLQTFDVLDPTVRARWAAAIADTGADVIMFDCLRPALDSLGLNEDKDAGRFLVALDQLKAEAGVSEMQVVHHMGHDAKRSRGDSRIVDWPDATWKIHATLGDDGEPDLAAPREFSAFGRDVKVERTTLHYDHPTRHLTLEETSTRQQGDASVIGDVVDHVRDNPDVVQKDLLAAVRKLGPYPRDKVYNAIQSAISLGRIISARGDNNSYTYRVYAFQE